ncbi:thioredoxin domain-containing protein [uncultured Nitratireductor sp.]|uniref:thioredoxin domain-containing protein n=1 Tax=uncultured Nitratireductor sp. TaxID=520953 RepID=UPI0025F7D892|nr:thioredoxin domain-containing protein [uncultured Nitratireductor sp.]
MISRRDLLAGASGTLALVPLSAGAAPGLDDMVCDPGLKVLGNPAGDVTIAEFFDYLCPSCKAIHAALKESVRADGRLRLVMKDWPINGGMAWYASRMVHASAGLGVYEPAHNAVMTIEGELTHGEVDDALRSVGADAGDVRDMLDVHLTTIDALIARNQAHARALRLDGTPGFLIGDRLYRRPLAVREIVEAVALMRAKWESESAHEC